MSDVNVEDVLVLHQKLLKLVDVFDELLRC